MLVADIDHFKSINDTYGHDAGDSVLREFAQRFRRNTRGIDLACRMGGEEFVVVMPDTPLERARQVGERCARASPPSRSRSTRPPQLTRDGQCRHRDAGRRRRDAWRRCSERADQALYAAKREGRNRVVADAA